MQLFRIATSSTTQQNGENSGKTLDDDKRVKESVKILLRNGKPKKLKEHDGLKKEKASGGVKNSGQDIDKIIKLLVDLEKSKGNTNIYQDTGRLDTGSWFFGVIHDGVIFGQICDRVIRFSALFYTGPLLF